MRDINTKKKTISNSFQLLLLLASTYDRQYDL